MAVPNTFNLATGTIPLSQLDANFAYYDAAFSITGANLTFLGTATLSSGTVNGVAYLNASKVLTTGSGLQFNESNLGLATAPSAWSASATALDMRLWAAFFQDASGGAGVAQNAYQNTSNVWTYKRTDFASRYDQIAGVHRWFTAPSGTAGNAISFTQAFKVDNSNNLLLTGGGGLGYGTGSGGTVTQATSRSTAVTVNKPTGSITMLSAAGSTSWSGFVVNNSLVGINDAVILSLRGGNSNFYTFQIGAVGTGNFQINFLAGGTAIDAPIINFAIIKGAVA